MPAKKRGRVRRTDLDSQAWRQLRSYMISIHHGPCAICMKPINLELSGLHKHGPSIDHLVPVTAGGTHTPTNLRVVHTQCNSKKGNRPQGNTNSRAW